MNPVKRVEAPTKAHHNPEHTGRGPHRDPLHLRLHRSLILEHNEVAKELGRVNNVLNEEIRRIDSVTNDWAAWDDTHIFITDLNQWYIDSNLVEGSFTTNGINMRLFYDSSGTLRFSKAFSLVDGGEVWIPAFFEGDLRDEGLLTTTIDDNARSKLSILGGTFLESSRPSGET